jgi:hypothetical protein
VPPDGTYFLGYPPKVPARILQLAYERVSEARTILVPFSSDGARFQDFPKLGMRVHRALARSVNVV